jgi:excisionase family DNA binding protein
MPMLSPSHAARHAGVSRRTLMRAIAKGKLPAQRTNTGWEIDEAGLAEWARAHAHGQPTLMPSPVPTPIHELQARIAGLEMELALERQRTEAERQKAGAESRRATTAETDRDHWRAMAQRSLWQRLMG